MPVPKPVQNAIFVGADNRSAPENFVPVLLRWYARHARSLPWRIPGSGSSSVLSPSHKIFDGENTGNLGVLGRLASQNTQISASNPPSRPIFGGEQGAAQRSSAQGDERDVPDPYRVWVSEIMLQQTRVETVIPYFEHWMQRFPSVEALAAASQQDVLAAWEGLGYYSRARCLHRAAQIVVAEHGGELPADVHQLQKLPGIGRYTAGAIASIAFGLDQPALDGNIRRVLSRLFNVTEQARSPAGLQRLWQLAEEHLPPGRAGDYNQALMDLGACLCTPRAPKCSQCPLAEHCQARVLGVQEQRPVVAPRKAVPHYLVAAAVIARPSVQSPDRPIAPSPSPSPGESLYLIAQRPAGGLLGGLWEFPGGKVQPGEDLPACLRREICEELGVDIAVGAWVGVYRHAYTHFRVTLHAFCCTLAGSEPHPIQVDGIRWVKPEDMPAYPMGKIDRQIAKELMVLNTKYTKETKEAGGM